ncbi:uncharacterized protein NPIL_326731 [Nephila pilipes]|uniref:Uncharacterized protein n=1 Tax=Nephila pilipes TaxID=299642 RepID=A0A8X6QMB7_NEPPI|nr:uncharacterized protein NPIL_326731 [Nephila pilipes]
MFALISLGKTAAATSHVAPFHGRQLQVNLVSVVSPRSELHLAALVIEGEPSDVYLARTFEDARRDVGATAVVPNHHVRVVRSVELLVCTATNTLLVYTENQQDEENGTNYKLVMAHTKVLIEDYKT